MVFCTYGNANMHISRVVMVNIVFLNAVETDKFVRSKWWTGFHYIICSIEQYEVPAQV